MHTQNTAPQLDYYSTAEERRESILQRVVRCIEEAQQKTKRDTTHVLNKISNGSASNDNRFQLQSYDKDFRRTDNPYLRYSVEDLRKTLDSVQNNMTLRGDEKRQHSALIRLAYHEFTKSQRR